MDINFSKSIGTMARPTATTSTSRNFIIEAVLLLIFMVLFVWFLILPKRAEIAEKKVELAKIEEQKKTTEGQVQKLKALVADLQSKKEDIKLLDTAIPLQQNTPQLEYVINDIAAQSGVSIGGLALSNRPGIVSGNKQLLADPFGAIRGLQKVTGSIYAIGNFNQLKSFIVKLENSGRLINITDMQIDPSSDSTLNLRVGVNLYYFAE